MAYLSTVVAAPLTEAMAQLAVLQPEDPVEFLGNYLLKFVANEVERQQQEERGKQQQQPLSSTATASSTPRPKADAIHDPTEQVRYSTSICMYSRLKLTRCCFGHKTKLMERNMHMQLQNEPTVSRLIQRFLQWLCETLNAEEAYLGRKCVDVTGQSLVHWVASSHVTSPSVTIDKFVTEEQGITFDAFREVEDSAAPVDEDGNPLPPAVPRFLHVENVLREPRMKFFHVPKLGAYLTRGLKYKSFLHPDVINEANPEEPNIKDEWLAVSVDTMGQARSFTQREIESFQRSTALFIQALEELERTLYMAEMERRTTQEDPMLREFHVAFGAQVAVQEENLVLQMQTLDESKKNGKESELRLAFMTYMLVSHTTTLGMVSARVIPFKQPVLVVFAAALNLLGYSLSELYNPVTKLPSWDRIAPLMDEIRLKERLEAFNITALPPVPEAKRLLFISKSDVDAAIPIALCMYQWVQAVLTHADQLEAAAELERQQQEKPEE